MAVDDLATCTGALLVLIGILSTASNLLLGLRHSLLLWIGISLLDLLLQCYTTWKKATRSVLIIWMSYKVR